MHLVWPQSRFMADVSDYQTSVDMQRYRRAGRTAIMIKAGQGLGFGGASLYRQRVLAAHAVGLRVIHYWYVEPDVPAGLTILSLASQLDSRFHAGDRICWDVETGDPAAAARWLAEAQSRLRERLGQAGIAYTYADYLARGGRALAATSRWWIIADYESRLLGVQSALRLPAGQLLGQQFTDGTIGGPPRSVPGVRGPCDDTILTSRGYRWLVGSRARHPRLRRSVLCSCA
jgi:GH25 family lysozyme M1 (1,4-beta-N-acetylmuramidase)